MGTLWYISYSEPLAGYLVVYLETVGMCMLNTTGPQLRILHGDPPGAAVQQGEAPQQRGQVGEGACCQH